MSMQTYPINAYGLLFYEEELEILGIDEDDISNFSDFEGEFYPFTQGRESISFHGDGNCYIAPLSKGPSLFSQAYADYEETKAEILSHLKEFHNVTELPFDIYDRLGKLSGTVFG